ncbi:MAG: AAA family ATPase [Sphingopyxis sp.]|nr:AAA family ATPase [Sphingopyxis sp.]
MIPPMVPPAIRADPRRSAEVAVYDRLAESPLLTGATIFYSCEWLGAHGGILRDGEADFVVAHPGIGYLVLEVKGGRVRRSVADGKWTTIDRDDNISTIENPVRQAMKSKKVILDALMRNWPGRPPWITARHGVILPHSSSPADPKKLGAATPIEIFAFREDMGSLAARVLQMMVWSPDGAREKMGGLGSVGIGLLEDFYGRDVDFSPRLQHVLRDSEARIDALTGTQLRYLDFLASTRIALIEGGAGTGKTVLAAERARRAAREGRRVLLLCFNRPLATALAGELAGSSAAVATFHEFCGRMCLAAGIDLDAVRRACEPAHFWQEKLPELLTDIGLGDPPERYDDIIVDEGQDFRAAWIEAVRLFLEDEGSLFIFRDDFQNLYRGDDAAAAVKVAPMRLTENVRNTQKIFRAGNRFRSDCADRCLGPEGADIRWVASAPGRTARSVEREVSRLLTTEAVSPDDIAVLCGCAAEASIMRREPMLAGRPWTGADECVDGAIVVDSIMRFKGLDRPVVILCEIEGCAEEAAYVGLTRAKSLLVVTGSETALEDWGRTAAAIEAVSAP